MNLGQIRARCKLYLNVNASQLNDDISDANWNDFINQAYSDVWMRVRTQVSRATLLISQDIQWPPGAQTLTLPTNLQNAVVYDIWQLDGAGNPLVQFGGFFETRNVLRMPSISWSTAGYTMRIYFIPEVEVLAIDDQSPLLIPPQYHNVITWEALMVAKALYDKAIPDSWEAKRNEIELSLVKEQSTRPVAFRANIGLATSPMVRPLANATL